MAKLGISTVLLTDDLILKYSDDRVILNKGNINLKVDKIYEPVPGGLYDSNYFGSVLLDTCNCRAVKKVNVYCYNCGSTPLDEATRNSRFARIELPCHYVPYFKQRGVESFLTENFKLNYEFENLPEVSGRGKLIKALELGQIKIEIPKKSDKPVITFHDSYTDVNKCSYEGLFFELNRVGLTNESKELKRFIDKNVLVLPASMRGIQITNIGGKKELTLPKTTSIYQSIIMAKEQVMSIPNKSIKEDVWLKASLRAYVRKALMELSEFTKSSKENLGRKMFSARVPNTFRSVITAGPELKLNEVSIPIQNAYAILKDRFIEKLMVHKELPYFKALKVYDRGDQETLDLFESWVTEVDPKLILVRQPTLHKYSMMAFRFKIHKGHDMKMPLEIVGPFGGDFDKSSLLK